MGATIQVDVDVEDVFFELSTDQLRAEMVRRGEQLPSGMEDALAGAAPADVPAILAAYQRPKWPTIADCLSAYRKAMGR